MLLRNPDFFRLFLAYLITFSGNAMAPIAMAFGVLEITASAGQSAIVIAAPIAGQVLALLVGGAIADRTSRQKLMVFAESLAAVCRGMIAVLFITGKATVLWLTLLAMINGVAAGLFVPCTTGFITQVVAWHELQSANSLLGMARSFAMMVGAALAGVLVAAWGAGVTVAVDGATFVLSAILIASVTAGPQQKTARATLLKDLQAGWQEFISHQWLWTIVLQFSLLVAACESVFGLLGPAVAKLEMNGPMDWGIIAASSGLGTVLGGMIALRLNVARPMLAASICCFFFAGLPLSLAAPAPLPVVVLLAFINGIAIQIFSVLWYTTLQTQIPFHMLSRVSAYDHLGSVGLAPLGIVVAGALFEAIGGFWTMLLAAATIIVPTVLVLLVPGVRNLRKDAVPDKFMDLDDKTGGVQ